MLGFIAVAVGLPAPILMWKFGPKLRARSSMARRTEAEKEEDRKTQT